MLDKFQQYIQKNNLFTKENKVLLAVSGGIDSVVMVHLFKRAGYDFAIAHCNFLLRGEDADKDELLCKDLGAKLDVPFLSVPFNTKKVAEEKGISIQMAARELRYEWFREVSIMLGYDYVATAHHLNDAIETVLFNFTKGCGLRGLHGIPIKNGDTIRPLLFATRSEIENYAKEYKVTYREDASNAETKYARNKIRHEVIPTLQQINTAFEASAGKTIQRIQEAEILFDFAIKTLQDKWCKTVGEGFEIEFTAVKKHAAAQTILFESLKKYHFNADQIAKLLNENTQSGAIFYSSSHRLLLDREKLFVQVLSEDEKSVEAFVQKGDTRIPLKNAVLQLDWKEGSLESFSNDKNIAYFDTDALKFPLKIRHWKAGDAFQPIGMNGMSKKLKDYFVDQKLSRFDKEKVLILENNTGEIIWIMGHRGDERFKITEKTKKHLVACYFLK